MFAAWRDHALATVVLSVNTSLLYLVGNPEDPVVVSNKPADQFERKMWATRLNLCRNLHSLRLKDGDPVQEHINALSVAGETVSEEDLDHWLGGYMPYVSGQQVVYHSPPVKRSHRCRVGRWTSTYGCRKRESGVRHCLTKW